MKKESSNRAVVITAIIMAILIVATAIFCVLFYTCSKTNTDASVSAGTVTEEENPSTDSSDTEEEDPSTDGAGAEEEDPNTDGAGAEEEDPNVDGAGAEEEEPNTDGAGAEEEDSNAEEEETETPVEVEAKEVDTEDIDDYIENLVESVTAASAFDGSYYFVCTTVTSDLYNGTAVTEYEEISYDVDTSDVYYVETYSGSESDNVTCVYFIPNGDDLEMYIDYTDNIDEANSHKVIGDIYADFGLYILYLGCRENAAEVLLSTDTSEFVISSEKDLYDFLTDYSHLPDVEFGSDVQDNFYNEGDEYLVVYEYGDETVYCCRYSIEFTYEGSTYAYTYSTSLWIKDGKVVGRNTEEEIIVTDENGDVVYDTTYVQTATMAYECDTTIFEDLDFSDYVEEETVNPEDTVDPDNPVDAVDPVDLEDTIEPEDQVDPEEQEEQDDTDTPEESEDPDEQENSEGTGTPEEQGEQEDPEYEAAA